jgi:hypothetical protein
MELTTTREAASCAASENFSAFYGTRRFITAFARVPVVPVLSQTNLFDTTPFISPRSSLIFTQLCLGLHRGLIPSGFSTNNIHAFLLPPYNYLKISGLFVSKSEIESLLMCHIQPEGLFTC